MKLRNVFVVMIVLLAASVAAFAGDANGRFANHDTKVTQTVLADGRTVVSFDYYELWITDNADDPIANSKGDCAGRMILSKEGATLSGSGVCFTTNLSGDGTTLWWKVDEAGTSRCPDICGSWAYVNGYGKLKGVTGSGTWVRTVLFSDGSLGTYKGTYTKK